MESQWTIVENALWSKKWLFFWKFNREMASSLAHQLIARAMRNSGAVITVEEDDRMMEAVIDFIKSNVPKKSEHRFVWLSFCASKDPRRFAMQMSMVPCPMRPASTQVEWTYDFRPQSKIQGRQLNEY